MSDRTARFCWLCLMLVIASSAAAASHLRRSLDSLVQDSDYVIYGRVIQSRFVRDAATGVVWTQTDILVLDGLKGQPGSSITVSEPGGVRDGIGELYPGVPQLHANQELVLFLYRTSANRLRVTGAMRGLYNVRADAETGERWVQPAVRAAEVAYEEGSPSDGQMRAQAGGKDRLSRFLYDIRQRVAIR